MTSALPQYPGENARPCDLLALAREYHRAADALSALGRKGAFLSRSPKRMNAIHAIELYMDAMLLERGFSPSDIRGLQHDLAQRRTLLAQTGVVFGGRTSAHLDALTQNREYIAARYGTESGAALSPMTRLQATLDQIASRAQPVPAGPAPELECALSA